MRTRPPGPTPLPMAFMPWPSGTCGPALLAALNEIGVAGGRDAIGTIIDADRELNAQGLVVWLTREEANR